MKIIDLRSDTVTKPSPAMRQAMMAAEVGDDVFGEDPTVNLLEHEVAALFGKEAALFVPSGTMGNELCIKTHTAPGDEVIVDEDAHVVVYETAGPAFLSAVQLRPLHGRKGVLPPEEIESAIRPATYYMPPTTLLCLENTHGRSGGSVVPLEYLRAVSALAKRRGIRLHLDGARIWNAHIASGVSLKEYGGLADSLSVCFSKGLGAPVGSMILGTSAFIERARRYRKIFGGGMRQVGILAAAALYAVRNNVARLAEDHEKARWFGAEMAGLKGWKLYNEEVETNMAIFDIRGTGMSQAEILSLLKSNGVLLTPEREHLIRSVTHLDVSWDDVKEAVNRVRSVVGRR